MPTAAVAKRVLRLLTLCDRPAMHVVFGRGVAVSRRGDTTILQRVAVCAARQALAADVVGSPALTFKTQRPSAG